MFLRLAYILPILLSGYSACHALPVYDNATSLGLVAATLADNDTTSQGPLRRTLFGVAWSCVLTVFICAWTSVHPNVPPRGVMHGLWARVKLMFWTIVAPELVLAWAVRQWFAAREIKNIYNSHVGDRPSKLWTTAHGHFLQMGGFALISDKIHQVKEPEQPGLLSTSTDWDPYAEYVRRKKRYELGVLTFDQFKTLVGNVPFPDITPAQINDRSKGDGLSKLLAILQSSWFIAQCIARGVQGLALTELELVTLAMASLNAITFVFWWNKPLSVQEPVHVYVAVPVEEAEKNNRDKDPGEIDVVYYTAREVVAPFQEISEVSFDPRHQLQHIRDGEYSDVALHLVLFPVMLLSLAFLFFPLGILFLLWLIKSENVDRAGDDDMVAIRVELSLRRLRYKLTHPIRQYFGSRNGPLSRILDSDFGDDPASFAIAWFLFIPASFHLLVLLLITLSPLFAIFSIASFTFTAAFGIVTTNKVPRGATHVPPFYAPRTNSDRFSRMIVFAIFGVIFGSIHCIAWNFTFPTSTERSLWRYTSLVLTAIPLVVAPIDCALENLKDIFGKKSRLAFAILMTALLFLYVPARMSLIFQALALLRDQPASAYVAVDWTKYIPHLFSS